MKHITSKLLSLLLCLAMLMSMIPAAYATDDGESTGGENSTEDTTVEPAKAVEANSSEGATALTSYVTVNGDAARYATLDDAIAAAEQDESGVITYTINGKAEVTATGWVQVAKAGLTGLTEVKFVGEGTDAEISIVENAGLLADQMYDIDVSFANLILSKKAPGWVGDMGHAANYFTCWLRNKDAANNTVTYTNCTFPNGVCNNQYGKTVFDNCQFTNNASGLYNLWNYGGNTEIKNSTFTGVRGIKTYNEGTLEVAPTVTVENTAFNGLTEKAAIVASKATNITLTGISATDCAKGFFQKDIEGSSDAEKVTIAANGSGISGTFKVTAEKTAEAAKNELNITSGKLEAVAGNRLSDLNDYLADNLTISEDGTVTESPSTTAVAKIGTVEYMTLQDAINAAGPNKSIHLLTDIALSETAIIPESKNLTINLRGHNITAEGTVLLNNGKLQISSTGADKSGVIESTKNVAVAVGNNSKLTVNSGTLKGREGAVITGLSTGATIEIKFNATLIATDNAVISGNGSAREGNPNTITIKGSTFIGGIQSDGYIACGIYAPWNDNVTVSGGTFNITNGAGIVARAGTVMVTGGTFNCTDDGTGWVGDNKNQLPCAALVFDKAANYPALTESSQILVSGGSFSTDPAANGATLASGYVATLNESGMYGVNKANPVAEINGVKYDTLQAAITAAGATEGGATIKLLANINTSSYYEVKGANPVTIDLAGYNITGSGISGLFYVTAKGDLTIRGEGTVTAVEDNGAAMAVWVRSPIAKVTLEGGTYTQLISNTTDPQFDLIYVERGNVYVKGGTYKGFTPDWTLNCKDEHYQSKEANIEVTGGTFVGFDPTNNKAEGENTNFVPAGYVSTKGVDGNFVVTEANYVAEVNGVKYETLQAAIEKANKGATVKLLRDTKENVTIDKMMTLDLNGFTLNGGTEKGKPALTITARVTVMDSSEAQTGTIMREDTAENSGVSSHYVIDIQGAGWLTFESGNVKNNSGNTEGKGASLVRVGNDSVAKQPGLVIKGGTFTQNNFIVIKVDRGYLKLYGGTLNSASSYAVENWFNATIKGGTVNGAVSSWTYSDGFNSTLTVEDGTINGDVTSVNYGNANKVAKVEITGGTVTGKLDTRSYDPATGKLTSITDAAKATIKVSGGTFDNAVEARYCDEGYTPVQNSDGKYGVQQQQQQVLAKIGDTAYYTMDEAFRAVQEGETIVMQRDYTTGAEQYSGNKSFIIDLNGKTWTYTGTNTNHAAFEINHPDVTLTVKNGTVASNSMVGLIPSVIDVGGTITYDNAGLVFEGVTMTANGHSGIETNGNNANDTVTLKNSTLNVPDGFGIYFPSSGTLTIDNSTINAKTMGVQVCAGSLSITGDKTAVTVTGDAVPKTENDGAIQDGAAISIVNRTGYKGLGDITVTGGTFKANGTNAAIKAYDWNNANKKEDPFTESDNVAVSGGTFSSAVPEDLCAEGYEPIKNPDDTYGVKASTPVAVVNDVQYYTLKKAIAAAKDGETVKLLDNVDLTETLIIKDKAITLDLNGKTISNSTDIWNDSIYAWSLISVRDNGDLTINDTAGGGTLKAKENDCFALDVYAYDTKNVENTKLTINAGNYVGNISAVYAFTGKVTINGGHFSIQQKESGSDPYRFTLNCFDSSYKAGRAGFTVNGGTFENFDPRNNPAEGTGTSFVAEGVGVDKNTDGSFTAKSGMAAQIVDADGNSVAAYATLQGAVNAAKSGETVLMLTDVDLGNSHVKFYTSTNKATNVTVDLGGHTLSSSASSTITTAATNWTIQNGTIKNTYPTVVTTGGAVNVPSSSSITLTGGETGLNIISESVGVTIRINNGAANVTIKDGVTISGQYGAYLYGSPNGYNRKYTGKTALTVDGGTINGTIAGIAVWGPGNKNVAATATLTVNGGTITSDKGFGIAGTGNPDNQVPTTINITGGTISSGADTAIYHPQKGTLTISGGTISGVTGGVQMCAGTLEVTGGTITATGNGDTSGKTGDGSIPDGAAVSIVNRNYPGGIPSATITGGTLTSANGVDAVNAYGWRNNAKTDWTERKDKMNVSGGTFSSAVLPEYCATGFVPTKNADGTFGVKVDTSVAEVNGKKYETLQEAIAAAQNGDTVKLLADVIQNTMLTIDKNITLDLNGKKIYNTEDIWSDSKQTYELISVEAKVTITGNGSIEAKENDCYTINVKNGNLTIENGTFVGNISVVQVEKGTLTINGGEFKLLQKWEGTSKYLINCIDKSYADKTAVVDIRGGTFVDFDPNVAPEKKVDGKAPSFVISAGIGVTKDADGNFTAVPNMAAQIVDVDGNSVAAYAGHYDAIAAAKNGETVILLSDCKNFATNTINANITIDLNGKTLSVGNNNPFFRTNGEVTIQNGTITSDFACVIVNAYNKLTLKNVKITGVTGDNGKNLVNVCSNAEVTIDKDTVLTASGSGVAVFIGQDADAQYTLNVYGKVIQNSKTYAICGNGSYKGTSTINIYDGAEVKSPICVAIYQPQAGVTNIYGGLVEGKCAIGIKSGALNISGGTVRGTVNDNVLSDDNSNGNGISYDGSAIIVDSRATGYAGNVKINVTGGTVESYYSNAIREIGNDPSVTQLTELTVTGGNVFGASSKTANVTNDMLVRDISVKNVSVSGGTFKHEVQSEYCAIGFVPKANSDGTYGVKAAEGNAYYTNEDGKVVYGDLSALLTDSDTEGKTITLLTNVTSAKSIALWDDRTIDLAGLVLEFTGNAKFMTMDGWIKDSTNGNGLLKIAQTYGEGKQTTAIQSSNEQLPIYDSAKGGYRLFDCKMVSMKQAKGDGVVIWLCPQFKNLEAYKLLKSGNAHNTAVSVIVSWNTTSGEKVSRSFEFTQAMMDTVVNNYNFETNRPGQLFKLTLTGLGSDLTGVITNVAAQPCMGSKTGALKVGEMISLAN